jgi:hypothetical protein
MFWFASGTFFYYSMLLLTHALPEHKTVLQVGPQQQKKALLLVIIIVQFVFYVIAAGVAVKKDKEGPIVPY